MKKRQTPDKILSTLWWIGMTLLVVGLYADISAAAPKFDTWGVSVMSNGAPKIQYVDLETMTHISFTYINSKDCTDLKLQVVKFLDPVKASIESNSFRGGFLIDDKKFLFSAKIPPSEINAGLEEFIAIWPLDGEFISALFSAKEILWTDSEQQVNHFGDISVVSLPEKMNRLMLICHNAYIRTFPFNGIIINNPSKVNLY